MKNNVLLISGNSISKLGSIIFSVSMNLWIISITGDAKLLGIILFLSSLSTIAFNLISGVISDKFNKKMILFFVDFISGIILLISSPFISPNSTGITILILVNIFLSIGFSLFSTTSKSIIPNVIDKSNVKDFNSTFTFINQIIKIVGPSIASFLFALEFIDIKGIFIINGISFILSSFLVSLLNYEYKYNEIKQLNILSDIISGFKYIKNDFILISLLITTAMVNFFLAGYNLLLPLYTKNIIGSEYIYGLLLSSEALGAIVGSLLLKYSKKKDSSIKNISINLLLCGIVFLPLLFSKNLTLLILVIFFFGFFLARFNINFFTFIQINVNNEYLGRVFSIIFTIVSILMPFGSLIFGFVGNYILDYSFPIIGIGIILSNSFILLRKENYSKRNKDFIS